MQKAGGIMHIFFSNIKRDMILNAILFLLIGFVLLLFPEKVSMIACYALGIILLFYAFQLLHQYFVTELHSSITLFLAILLLLAGIFVIIRYDIIISTIPFLMGVVFLFYGLRECSYALALKQSDYPKWSVNLLLALLLILAACILLFYPFEAASFAIRIIGSLLIYSAVSQIWTIHCLSVYRKEFFK